MKSDDKADKDHNHDGEYLPLTGGEVTGNVEVDGDITANNATINTNLGVVGQSYLNGNVWLTNEFTMENNKYIYLKDTNGNLKASLHMNGANWLCVGQGGYDANVGGTNLMGNMIHINSKGNIAITSPTAGLNARVYGTNKVLWSGGHMMHGGQTITLNEAIKAQPHGIVLVWTRYENGDVKNFEFSSFFVPKQFVQNYPGCSMTFGHIGIGRPMSKTLYINNTTITGHADNTSNATINSISIHNDYNVLVQVIGV